MMRSLIGVLLVVASASCMYSSKSDVVELNPNNFDSSVLQTDRIWIVEFYAPWCGHCQSLVPEYDKAATALKGVVKVGAVNADDHRSLGSKYGVRGFPTIKIFGLDKNKPEDYTGQRTAAGIVEAGLSALGQKVRDALGDKRSGSDSKTGDAKDVIELTDDNFDKLVLDSEDMWLVEFYAPWCVHCKNLAPVWAAAATELKGKVKLGALDATVHTKKAGQYKARGYPVIKFFPPGKKDPDSVIEYDGRTTSDIVNWALDKLSENIPPPEIVQIVNEKSLNDACEDKPLCIVSVLPHILDCQSECRNQYLETLHSLGEKYKKTMWGWVWAEAGAQPHVEEALEIGGFGYPALAAVNTKKMKYALLKGSFSHGGINEFLRDLSYGRGGTAPLKGAQPPVILETIPWDGKDAEPLQEEDIDLSDVDLDDKDEL